MRAIGAEERSLTGFYPLDQVGKAIAYWFFYAWDRI